MSESSLVNHYFAQAYQNCIPLNASIELTLNCNLRCSHCYNFDRSQPQPKASSSQLLSQGEVQSVLDDLAQLGTLTVAFTGGEALLHPNIYDFIHYARQKKFLVKLKSNGVLLNEERLNLLVEAGLNDVDVSLYGASSESHEKITQQKGSFLAAQKGILKAKESGIKVQVNYILHNSCVDEVLVMREWAQNHDLNCAFSTEMTARYDGTSSSKEHQIRPEQFEKLLLGPLGDIFSKYDEDGNVQCNCARLTVGISSSGDVYPCIGAPIKCGNIRQQSLTKIWVESEELNRIRNLTISDFKTCSPCPHRKFCTRSSGGIFVDTGNYTGPEASACQEAEIRHKHWLKKRHAIKNQN